MARDGTTAAKAWLRSELIMSGTNQNYWLGDEAADKQQLVLNAKAEKDARAVAGFGALTAAKQATAITAAKALVKLTAPERKIIGYEGYVSGFYYDKKKLSEATITFGAGLTGTHIAKGFKPTFKAKRAELSGTSAVAAIPAVLYTAADEILNSAHKEGEVKTAAVAGVAAVSGMFTKWGTFSEELQTQLMSLYYRGDLKKGYKSVTAINAGNWTEAWQHLAGVGETDMYSVKHLPGAAKRKKDAIEIVAKQSGVLEYKTHVSKYIADRLAFYSFFKNDEKMQKSSSKGGYYGKDKEVLWAAYNGFIKDAVTNGIVNGARAWKMPKTMKLLKEGKINQAITEAKKDWPDNIIPDTVTDFVDKLQNLLPPDDAIHRRLASVRVNPINLQGIQEYTGTSVALVDSFEASYGNIGDNINEALFTHLNTHGENPDMIEAVNAGDIEGAIYQAKTNRDYINYEKTGVSNEVTDNIDEVIKGFKKMIGGIFNV